MNTVNAVDELRQKIDRGCRGELQGRRDLVAAAAVVAAFAEELEQPLPAEADVRVALTVGFLGGTCGGHPQHTRWIGTSMLVLGNAWLDAHVAEAEVQSSAGRHSMNITGCGSSPADGSSYFYDRPA